MDAGDVGDRVRSTVLDTTGDRMRADRDAAYAARLFAEGNWEIESMPDVGGLCLTRYMPEGGWAEIWMWPDGKWWSSVHAGNGGHFVDPQRHDSLHDAARHAEPGIDWYTPGGWEAPAEPGAGADGEGAESQDERTRARHASPSMVRTRREPRPMGHRSGIGRGQQRGLE